MRKIGFMQGRLSDQVDGKIQAFPWCSWEKEFEIASEIGMPTMEWTLDQKDLYHNPLMTEVGRCKVKSLCLKFGITIPSVTGDCFMQSPFWKACPIAQISLKKDFLNVCSACSEVGIKSIVVPLVDNGSIKTLVQEQQLLDFLLDNSNNLEEKKIQILFESDYAPAKLGSFIEALPSEIFGINYDIGNSASFGFVPSEEFASYGTRIRNVHVKDRLFKGGSVPLTQGDADFSAVFKELEKIQYNGNFILQTARSQKGSHVDTLLKYSNLVKKWTEEAYVYRLL